jgi:NADH:ubiquinone oxidoreductase subunit K
MTAENAGTFLGIIVFGMGLYGLFARFYLG